MLSVAVSMLVKCHKKWNSMRYSWFQAIENSWARQERKKENWPWSFKVLSLASGNLWAKLAEFACHSHKTNVNEDRTNRVYVGPQNCLCQDQDLLTGFNLYIQWSSPVIWKPNYLLYKNNLEFFVEDIVYSEQGFVCNARKKIYM